MKFLVLCLLVLGGAAAPHLRAQSEPAKPGEQNGANVPEKDLTGWQWANFVVLAGGLGYLGVRLGTPYFRGQTETIGKGLDDARERKAAAELRSAEVDRKLANLGADIDQLRKLILDEQNTQVERMRTQSGVEIERVRRNAAQQIESAGKQARLDLQQFASGLAIDLAEQRARALMSASLHQALTRQFVESLRVAS